MANLTRSKVELKTLWLTLERQYFSRQWTVRKGPDNSSSYVMTSDSMLFAVSEFVVHKKTKIGQEKPRFRSPN